MKKQRENALKRIIKNVKFDNFKGYQPYNDFKIVTDKFCLVAIKEENMTPFEVMQAKYDYLWLLTYDTSNQVQVNYEDLKAFYKLNNKEKDIGKRLYNINGSKYDIKLLKNVIDIIGETEKVYYLGNTSPLYFENNEGEIGLVLPVRTF